MKVTCIMVVGNNAAVGFVKLHLYQNWWYSDPDDWHVCVKAYNPGA